MRGPHIFLQQCQNAHSTPARCSYCTKYACQPNKKITKNFLCSVKTMDGSIDKICMQDGHFLDGMWQLFYFPDGHQQAGLFKGMHQIIQECISHGANLPDPTNLLAQCPEFKCLLGVATCCCHWIIFNEPDFVTQKSNCRSSVSHRDTT